MFTIFKITCILRNRDTLCIGILIQEHIRADYAFVTYTNHLVSRDSSHIYTKDAASRGIVGVGFDVVQYGLASTLGMFNTNGFQFFSNEDFLCPVDGAIMITASHLPYNRNGFKFFPNEGGLGKPDIKDILEHAANIYNGFTPESLEEAERKLSSSTTKVDYMAIYASNLVIAVRKASGKIGNPLEGFHIVVDAGKEAGGFFAVSYLLACVHNSLPRFSSDVQLTHHNKTNIGFAPTNTAILLGTVAHMIPTVIDSDMAMVLSSGMYIILQKPIYLIK
uniref:Alpha-D-phosphohexomutase alpha/beta/alpha domain-containing protein n=1 Tax=Lactuca sativa TaxID=4236 RepID=A0A9R1XTN0_LACSA|nr:hypothetical protein LSAT_V11C300154810 [Lactuca sativa]